MFLKLWKDTISLDALFVILQIKIRDKIMQSFARGSQMSSYEIELRNRVTQNNVTLRVTNSKFFIEILLAS